MRAPARAGRIPDRAPPLSDAAFQAVPILRIFDVAKAREFYVGFLGFTVDWEARFDETAPLYLQISRDGLAIHLSEHHGDACPDSTVLVQVDASRAASRRTTARSPPRATASCARSSRWRRGTRGSWR